jgi:hypothetical protein
MIDYSYYLRLTTPAAEKVKGLTFRKEVIYVGTFFAPQSDGTRQKFNVELADLNRWKQSVDLQLERGVLIDVPKGHTTDPDASKGKVVGAIVEKNSRGEHALFLDIQFADAESAKLAKTTQVSIFSPPEWQDGLGNTYSRPIRHVALTQQPVIPKLDAFTLIASLDEGSDQMNLLQQICDEIGIPYEPDADDQTLADAIIAAFNEGADPEGDEELLEDDMPADEELSEDDLIVEDEEEEEDTVLSLSLPVRRQVAAGRTARVDLLLSQNKITPAQGKQLKSKFCGNTLSLSDSFDSTMEVLALSESRKTGSRTSAQLQNGSSLTTNPLLKDADRRASAKG